MGRTLFYQISSDQIGEQLLHQLAVHREEHSARRGRDDGGLDRPASGSIKIFHWRIEFWSRQLTLGSWQWDSCQHHATTHCVTLPITSFILTLDSSNNILSSKLTSGKIDPPRKHNHLQKYFICRQFYQSRILIFTHQLSKPKKFS